MLTHGTVNAVVKANNTNIFGAIIAISNPNNHGIIDNNRKLNIVIVKFELSSQVNDHIQFNCSHTL
jgi:hypothetical protein